MPSEFHQRVVQVKGRTSLALYPGESALATFWQNTASSEIRKLSDMTPKRRYRSRMDGLFCYEKVPKPFTRTMDEI
jgi:hypothetical protein